MKLALCLISLVGCAALLAQNPPPAQPAAENISGMYTFLREGEFVQVTVEDAGHVTGFISRYGDSDSDRGVFLNQFFKTGKLDGNKLSFTTETVHLVWFELQADVEHNPQKRPGEEGYRILRGKLTEHQQDADKKEVTKVTDVALKSFPQDLGSNPSQP
ncbi:MAG TPA: hypothetical protein VF753_13945 [Terriglobales bacterium]